MHVLVSHDPVEDHDVLAAAPAPHRARGMRLAIDDVGAGFSSLRHIVLTAPDIIRLDRCIVAGVSTDPVLRTLTRSPVAGLQPKPDGIRAGGAGVPLAPQRGGC